MDSIRNKLRNWISNKWNYEIQCDVFETLDVLELQKLASMYGIDVSLSRIQICNKLAEILEKKRKEYKIILDKSTCFNSMDPISITNIEDIDPRNLITLEQNGRTYCFETEGLYTHITNVKKTNPYTNVPLEESHISQINEEYARYKTLKGKKFDKDVYASDTNLSAIVGQLTNYLPYTFGLDKFIAMDDEDLELFLDTLEYFYVYIEVKPTELKQYKIQIVQKLIKWILNNANNDNLRQAWVAFQKNNIRQVRDVILSGDLETLKSININPGHLDLLLSITSESGNLDIVKYLVELGADIHFNEEECLMISSENGAFEVVKYLVEMGADIHANNEFALKISIQNRHTEVMKYLVEMGADINIEDGIVLRLSIKNNDLETLKYLIYKGLDINTVNDIDENLLFLTTDINTAKYLIDNGIYVNRENIYGRTPLFYTKDKEIARLLIENGVDVNHIDINNTTALDHNSDIADILEEYGGKSTNNISLMNTIPKIKNFLNSGGDINSRNDDGQTMLFEVSKVDVADFLIKKGIDINVIDNYGRTALFYTQDNDMRRLLIDNGIDIHVKDIYGEIAL